MILPHLTLSTDVVILGTFAFVTLVGLALGQERTREFALSIYVGLVVAYELGGVISNLISGHGASLSTGRVRLILFAVPPLLLALGRRSHGRAKHHAMTATFILAILLSALIVASAIHLMDPEAAAQILSGSQIARLIFQFRLLWLGLVPIAAVGEAFLGSRRH